MLPRTTILVVVPGYQFWFHPFSDPAQSGSSLHWVRLFFLPGYQFSFCVCDIRPAWFGVSLPSGLKWLVASGCFIQIIIVFCGNILYVLMIWFYAYFFYWLVTFSNLCYWFHGLSFLLFAVRPILQCLERSWCAISFGHTSFWEPWVLC